MKAAGIIISILVHTCLCNYAYSQLWKQYRDSGTIFLQQKNTEKALEYYEKSMQLLETDSANTKTLAQLYSSLGSLFLDKKQYADAEKFYVLNKQVKEKLYGMESTDYAIACNNLGELYREMRKYDLAEKMLLQAIQIHEKISGKNAAYASSCSGLAYVYLMMTDYIKAEPLLVEVQQLWEMLMGKECEEYASACNNLGILYNYTGKYEKAEIQYLEALDLEKKLHGPESAEYAQYCNNLAGFYGKLGRYKEALPLSLIVLKIREKLAGKDNLQYASACHNAGNIYYMRGLYDSAQQYMLEAKEIRERLSGKSSREYAASCISLSLLYKQMGKFEKATSLSIETKETTEKLLGKNNTQYAIACDNLASLFEEIGQYEKVEALYLEALQIRKGIPGSDELDYAGTCDNLASFYWFTGQYEKAEELFVEEKAIRKRISLKTDPGYVSLCNNLGNFYESLGQYEKAELSFLEARKIIETSLGKLHKEYAGNSNNLGILYLYMDIRKAEPFILEAVNLYRSIDKYSVEYARSETILGQYYYAMGEFEKAEPLYKEASRILVQVLGHFHPSYANVCSQLAKFYNQMGEYDKAKSLFQDVSKIAGTVMGKESLDYSQTCADLAKLYWLQHNLSFAENKFDTSFIINADNLGKAFQFTSEKEKITLVKRIFGENNDAYSFYFSEKLPSANPYTISLFERNLVLNSAQSLKKQVFFSNDSVQIKNYYEWINIKKYLAKLYSKPIAERKENIPEMEEKANWLEKMLTKNSLGFQNQQRKISWADIQSKLNKEDCAIEFSSFKLTNGKRYSDTVMYVAIVLRKDKPLPDMVPLFTEKQFSDLLSSTGNKTGNDAVKELYASRGIEVTNNTEASKSVYDLIWKPLEQELKGIKTIYFAPASLLYRVAFAALPINDKEVLSDRYKLVQLATTASVTDQEPLYISKSENIQLYGGIQYDADTTALKNVIINYHVVDTENNRSLPPDLTRSGSFNYLPGTATEIDGIKVQAANAGFTVKEFSGINASEESFKMLDAKASPSVLHIATHGFFFPDPKTTMRDSLKTENNVFKQSDDPLLRSGLVFAGANNAWKGKPVTGIEDGILTSYEVSNMYLPNTKLVVLSACETALGDIQGGEGVYGLQRAFKMAGVQNLVMSLWKVPDTETAEFMQLFYKNIFAKESIDDAFYHAQAVMREKYRNDPYKWAAWILVR